MQTAEVRSPHRNTISYYTIHLIYQGPHATPNRNEQSRTAGAAASSRASIARQPAPQCQHAQQHVVSWCSTHTARPCRARPAGASVGALTGRVRICCHCHSVTDRSSGPAAPPVRHATRHTHKTHTHLWGGVGRRVAPVGSVGCGWFTRRPFGRWCGSPRRRCHE